ncbi:MAG: trypsin-like peptidase domain-containing protein [Myxococcota bacterium]
MDAVRHRHISWLLRLPFGCLLFGCLLLGGPLFGGPLLGCSSPSDIGATSAPNVYGEDDRADWYEPSVRLSADEGARLSQLGADTVGMFVRDRHVRIADPSAVLLCGSNVSDYPTGSEDGCFTRTLAWNVWSRSEFGDDVVPLCEDEPFVLQPSIGRCSGTLIAEDLVLTSGHCIDEDDDVETSVFVFNWRYTRDAGPGNLDYRPIPGGREMAFWVEQPAPGLVPLTRADVYHAVEAHFVLERASRMRPSGSSTNSTLRDYAVVRLDRPVALPRRPAPLRYDLAALPTATPLVVASFGKGLPLKTDDGAVVVDSWYCDPNFNPALTCNLHDAYSGGSGGGLFLRDGTLVAAHRGSATDYVYDEAGDCYRSRVVPDPVPFNDFPASAHLVAHAVDDFCQHGFAPDSELCAELTFREPTAVGCADGAIHGVGESVCCQRACTVDADCAVAGWGGGCADGACRREARCFSGELWERDACGRPAFRTEGSSDACVDPGDRCATAEPLAAMNQRIPLSLAGFRNRSEASCGGAFGPDRNYRLELSEPFDVRFEIDGNANGWILELRGPGDCSAAEVTCRVGDAQADPSFEGRLEPGSYVLTVDTQATAELRAATWDAEPTLALEFRPIVSPPDAGVDASVDAAVPDASVVDGGVDAMAPPMSDDGGGCACGLGPDRPMGAWPIVLAFGLVIARRRR